MATASEHGFCLLKKMGKHFIVQTREPIRLHNAAKPGNQFMFNADETYTTVRRSLMKQLGYCDLSTEVDVLAYLDTKGVQGFVVLAKDGLPSGNVMESFSEPIWLRRISIEKYMLLKGHMPLMQRSTPDRSQPFPDLEMPFLPRLNKQILRQTGLLILGQTYKLKPVAREIDGFQYKDGAFYYTVSAENTLMENLNIPDYGSVDTIFHTSKDIPEPESSIVASAIIQAAIQTTIQPKTQPQLSDETIEREVIDYLLRHSKIPNQTERHTRLLERIRVRVMDVLTPDFSMPI